MLYICSVPLDANVERPNGTSIYVIDMLSKLSDRKNIDYTVWEFYRNLFNYERIWVVAHDEMDKRVIVNTRFHLGETL